MTSTLIPQDIISLIVEQHLFDDTSTLQACSLVSRSFVTPSRKGLFHTIRLDHYLKAQEECQKLHRVLLDNPELFVYVREMYIMDYTTDTVGPAPQRPYIPARPIHWASRDRTLHAILHMLPALRLFSFIFSDDLYSPSDWKTISVELKLALCAVFTSSSLTICQLEGVDNLPREFFSAPECLKELSLTIVSVSPDPSGLSLSSPAADRKKAQLELLELADISDPSSFFDAMRASVDLCQLREVSVCSEITDVVWEATRDATGSLETLTWYYYAREVDFSARNLCLAAFTALRVLRIAIEPCAGPELRMLQWLVLSLREIVLSVGDGVSNLAEITVHLDCRPLLREDEMLEVLQDDVWKDLDTLLTTSLGFRTLRMFSFFIRGLPDPELLQLSMGYVERLFCGRMPGLFKKGLLHVQPTDLTLEDIGLDSLSRCTDCFCSRQPMQC